MSRYSKGFKSEVVRYYINGHHGYVEAAKHFNVKTGDELVKKNGLKDMNSMELMGYVEILILHIVYILK